MKSEEDLLCELGNMPLIEYTRNEKTPDGKHCVIIICDKAYDYEEEDESWDLLKVFRCREKVIETRLDNCAITSKIKFTHYIRFDFKNALEQEEFYVNLLLTFKFPHNKMINSRDNQIWKPLKSIREELGLKNVRESNFLELDENIKITYNGLDYFNKQVITRAVMEKRI